MGILAFHAQNFMPLDLGFMVFDGTKSMPIIWLVAVVLSAFVALLIGLLSLRHQRGVFHHDYPRFRANVLLLRHFMVALWRRGRDIHLYPQRFFPAWTRWCRSSFFSICFAALLLALWLNARLVASPFGLALNAARQVPVRVQTVGLDPRAPETGGLCHLGRDHRAGRGAVLPT